MEYQNFPNFFNEIQTFLEIELEAFYLVDGVLLKWVL
jgi:hypothetical protein